MRLLTIDDNRTFNIFEFSDNNNKETVFISIRLFIHNKETHICLTQILQQHIKIHTGDSTQVEISVFVKKNRY